MKGLSVIIPVKSSDAKSRLSPVLSPSERRALSSALLRGVLSTLAKVGLIASTLVVSSDAAALRTAARFGARPVREKGDRGVNAAVGAALVAVPGSRTYLVLPSDLPLLKPADVLEIVRLGRAGMSAVISPSAAFDGTNALLFTGPRFPLSFDRNSFWNHLSAASRLGGPVGVCARAGVMFDVDSPGDLVRLAGSGSRSRGADLARGAGR